jgi:hypothetical protein
MASACSEEVGGKEDWGRETLEMTTRTHFRKICARQHREAKKAPGVPGLSR